MVRLVEVIKQSNQNRGEEIAAAAARYKDQGIERVMINSAMAFRDQEFVSFHDALLTYYKTTLSHTVFHLV